MESQLFVDWGLTIYETTFERSSIRLRGDAMSDKPGNLKKASTLLWSLGIALVLIVLTTGVLLPSTKRARIDFHHDPVIAPTRVLPITRPTTLPSNNRPRIPSSKSNHFDFDGQNFVFAEPTTQPEDP